MGSNRSCRQRPLDVGRHSVGQPSSQVRVSVCLATHDGLEFLPDQVSSILTQLENCDELIIVDDASADGSAEYLASLGDSRVTLVLRTSNQGYVRTFEQALKVARGRYLLLSDQDDVWADDHTRLLVEALGSNWIAATNLSTLNGPSTIEGPFNQTDWRLRASDSTHSFRNILGILVGNRPYYGCAMGIRSDALASGALPIPSFMKESHDLWFALFGNVHHSIAHVNARTVLRRLHSGNQTPNHPRKLPQVFLSRVRLICCIAIIMIRELRAAITGSLSKPEAHNR